MRVRVEIDLNDDLTGDPLLRGKRRGIRCDRVDDLRRSIGVRAVGGGVGVGGAGVGGAGGAVAGGPVAPLVALPCGTPEVLPSVCVLASSDGPPLFACCLIVLTLSFTTFGSGVCGGGVTLGGGVGGGVGVGFGVGGGVGGGVGILEIVTLRTCSGGVSSCLKLMNGPINRCNATEIRIP